nr:MULTISPECIES: oligosaccharide flippase family protein [unclassified Ruminococcus]
MTGSALLSRTLGMGFRVYMSNTIGANGIGLFQLICSIYFFCVTFSTSGITLIATRTVTECFARGENAKGRRFTSLCLYSALALSLTASIILYVFSVPICDSILGDTRAALSLRVMALGLPFLALSACFRGYFYARRKAYITASEQLLEQIAEIVIFAALAGTLAPLGIEYACCAVALGATGAEVLSFVYTYILYRRDVRKIKPQKNSGAGFFSKALSIGVPVTLSSTVRTGLAAAENVLIPRGLVGYGHSVNDSLSKYGIIAGMAMPLLTFPSAFLLSFSTLMIPELADAAATVRKSSIRHMTEKVLRFAFLFSAPASVIFFLFADNIGTMLFNESEVTAYIRILAPIVPLFYLDSVIDGMLKGLNEQLHYLTYNIIDSAVRVGLITLLLPIFGIKGLIAVYFISGILNTGLSLMRLIRVAYVDFKIVDWVVKPIACAALPCIILSMLQRIMPLFQNSLFTVIFLIISLLLYLVLICAVGAVSKGELDFRSYISPRKINLSSMQNKSRTK